MLDSNLILSSVDVPAWLVVQKIMAVGVALVTLRWSPSRAFKRGESMRQER